MLERKTSREMLDEKIQSVYGMREVKKRSLGTHRRPPPVFLLARCQLTMKRITAYKADLCGPALEKCESGFKKSRTDSLTLCS